MKEDTGFTRDRWYSRLVGLNLYLKKSNECSAEGHDTQKVGEQGKIGLQDWNRAFQVDKIAEQ